MRFNLKGIRFSTWLYFFLFAMAILLALGILQVALIKPYFRSDRINSIEAIASDIENNLLLKSITTQEDFDHTFNMIVNNNMCAIIFNESGKVIYEGDALGATCILNKETTINDEMYIPSQHPDKLIANIDESLVFSTALDSDYAEMLLYGKKIESNLANYYLFINTPVEPIESYVELFVDQYFFIALLVFGISLILSLIFSKRLTLPIINIRKEANKLRDGDYSAEFKTDSYTEINDLATTLNETSKRLEVVDELRKDLIANVSHDIKTPLTMIKAYSEMIRDISGDDKEKRNNHLEVIIDEVNYLDKLVDDMRDVSKLQAGQSTLHRTNFDMKDTILRIIEHYQGSLLKDTNLKLETDLKSCVVWADELAISRVISNFVSNAIKYSFDDSTIKIRMIDSDDKLRVEVEDDGKGISESELPYIWTRYYKIDKSFKRNSNSTGLGLAISKAILEAHGAKYGVSSKVNVGSLFYFELSKDYDEKSLS